MRNLFRRPDPAWDELAVQAVLDRAIAAEHALGELVGAVNSLPVATIAHSRPAPHMTSQRLADAMRVAAAITTTPPRKVTA